MFDIEGPKYIHFSFDRQVFKHLQHKLRRTPDLSSMVTITSPLDEQQQRIVVREEGAKDGRPKIKFRR